MEEQVARKRLIKAALDGRAAIEFKKAKVAPPQHKPLSPFGRCSNVSARYEKIGRVGEGTYGIVYKARDKFARTEDETFVALKRCLPHHESSDGFPLTTLREISTLRQLESHPGIITLKQVAVSSSRSGVFLVFEYCEHDLAHLVDAHYCVHKKSPFRESEVKCLAMQLLSALKFMHSRHFLHRDIKLSNLLYNSKGELRVADFGLSRKHSRDSVVQNNDSDEEDSSRSQPLTPKVVSLWYRPPELLFGAEMYDEGVDNWGVGCVIGELLLGVPLIKGRNELDQISKLFELLGPPTPSQWPGLEHMPLIRNGTLELPRPQHVLRATGKLLLDQFSHLSGAGLSLLAELLQYDSMKRLRAAEALGSKYFTELPAPANSKHMPRFPPKIIGI